VNYALRFVVEGLMEHLAAKVVSAGGNDGAQGT